MSEAKRPLPNLHEPDSRAFWEATREHELRYQECSDCGTVVFYPRRHCTGCLGDALEWKTAKGEGTVYTFSIIRQSYHPFFRGLVPYAVAWIDLDEGPRLLSNVIGPADDVRIGQRVRVSWEDHEELAVPLFEPI